MEGLIRFASDHEKTTSARLDCVFTVNLKSLVRLKSQNAGAFSQGGNEGLRKGLRCTGLSIAGDSKCLEGGGKRGTKNYGPGDRN